MDAKIDYERALAEAANFLGRDRQERRIAEDAFAFVAERLEALQRISCVSPFLG